MRRHRNRTSHLPNNTKGSTTSPSTKGTMRFQFYTRYPNKNTSKSHPNSSHQQPKEPSQHTSLPNKNLFSQLRPSRYTNKPNLQTSSRKPWTYLTRIRHHHSGFPHKGRSTPRFPITTCTHLHPKPKLLSLTSNPYPRLSNKNTTWCNPILPSTRNTSTNPTTHQSTGRGLAEGRNPRTPLFRRNRPNQTSPPLSQYKPKARLRRPL